MCAAGRHWLRGAGLWLTRVCPPGLQVCVASVASGWRVACLACAGIMQACANSTCRYLPQLTYVLCVSCRLGAAIIYSWLRLLGTVARAVLARAASCVIKARLLAQLCEWQRRVASWFLCRGSEPPL